MDRPVKKKYWVKRGLCGDCGQPVVKEPTGDEYADRFSNGSICKENREHPGRCCKCFDDLNISAGEV